MSNRGNGITDIRNKDAFIRPPKADHPDILGKKVVEFGDLISDIIDPGNTPEEVIQKRDAVNKIIVDALMETVDTTGIVSETRTVPGSNFEKDAPDLELTITTPSERTADLLPLIYAIPGGGLVVGGPVLDSALVNEYVRNLNCVVVQPKYRLAPTDQYPAAIEDCYAGLKWAADHAEELGINPDNIVTHGLSSGGHLAAALSHLMRDRGEKIISGQLLLYPILDDRPSYNSSAILLYHWNCETERLSWQAYLGDLYGRADLPPYAAPLRETDYRGLPPTIIHGAELDQDRDQLMAYAQNLYDANVFCELHIWGGVWHGFHHQPEIDIAAIASQVMIHSLKSLLTGNMPKRE
jgi:acetyl esterase/lipase